MSRTAPRSSSARPTSHAMNGHRNHGRPAQPKAAPARKRSIWDDLPVQVVPTENLPSFAELGLPAEIVAGLDKRGIAAPFPIQAATIPDAITGRDVLGRAATGSGKTLAFGLAMIARLDGGARLSKRPRGLVLVPTRELAMQVADSLGPAARDRGMRTMIVAGGMPIQKQINQLSDGVDIVVATPGRLVDLIDRRSCRLDAVEVTVLDEADHMADLGFLPVVRRLLDQTPGDGQRLLFSATLDGDVATLVENYLVNPAVHALSQSTASVDTMTHHVFRVQAEAKFDLIASIANREGRSILFVRTKHGADRLAKNLSKAGVAAGALHGDRTQAQRTRALDAFKDGTVPVLVATDVAARGIHVDDVSLVLHVDPPQDPKDYLHRSGRTARAGESGTVVMLVTSLDERKALKMITEAGVSATEISARAGDPTVATVTGARTPSGISVLAPSKPQPAVRVGPSGRALNTNGARRRPAAGRPAAAGAAGARHPQSAERRPRRERTH
ncbi:DEAD/DEAH box helicase [Jatrophihabitans sp.]|uniref:DEAD/DEAH box helicase n=1 Tax=Jatrophihabitans sp. TaxID=1932789 RepID=UPI0030C6E664|nr:box helicase domain protein [Jatrophihabitans sp.]